MDAEQSGDIVGSDIPQQEMEVASKMESHPDPDTPGMTNGDVEQVNGHPEVENKDSTAQADVPEEPKMEENVAEDEPACSPSEKDDLVAEVVEEANRPEQDDKPVETPVNESTPEPVTVQETEESQPPTGEGKVMEAVEVQSANDVAGEAEKEGDSAKEEEGKMAAESGEGEKKEEKPEVKESEPEVTATAMAEAEAAKPEQEEPPTPATGSLAFAMLEKEGTKDVLKTTRTLVVLRGLPGSGKTFLACAISQVYEDHSAVLSADDYSVKQEGPDAYKALDEAIVAKCSASPSPVLLVVDDVNLTQDRLAHLGAIAKRHQLVAIFLEPRTEWSRDVAQLAKKTKRGLKQDELEAMRKSHVEMSIPLYFGWFLSSTVQDKAREMSMSFLKTLMTLESFKTHQSDFPGKEGADVNLEEFFKAKGTLHCTTKFTNYGKAEGAKEYAESEVVQQFYSSATELSLSALFVTPRTVGAQVSLTEDQLQLWPDNAEKEVEPIIPNAGTLPRGSRAHVTLGCAEGVQAVQTGYDLLQILLLQKDGQQREVVEELDLGTLTYYEEGRWFLSLKQPVTAAACFSSAYKAKVSTAAKKEKKKQRCTIL